MEIMEELQNQSEIPPKRMKLQEIDNKVADDRISALPDCLIIEILSRLSTKAAIRTGTLSKRWEHLWTSLPNLLFSHSDHKQLWSDFVSFTDKTLAQCRNLKLKKFEVCSADYQSGFGSHINNWILHAVQCNVEHLILTLLGKDGEADFLFDEFFFITSCFIHLRLSYCTLNPTTAIRWKNIRIVSLSCLKSDEDLIENIQSGSPVLETLELKRCYGYRRIDITSKTVKNFVFSRYKYTARYDDVNHKNVIEINAPNILSLTIKGDLYLEKVFLVNVSSLVEAKLEYEKRWPYETTYDEEEEKMLKRFIISLRHVKDLQIGAEILCRLEANEVN